MGGFDKKYVLGCGDRTPRRDVPERRKDSVWSVLGGDRHPGTSPSGVRSVIGSIWAVTATQTLQYVIHIAFLICVQRCALVVR
jgi:hypothetical protein